MARLSLSQRMCLATIMILYLHMMKGMLLVFAVVMLLENRSRHSRGTKRKRSEETFSELVDQIGKFRDSFKVASDGINKIATYFERELGNSDRMQHLYSALTELGGLTTHELFDVLESMFREPHKIDAFMGLPEEVRKEYVWKILGEYNVYRPPLDP